MYENSNSNVVSDPIMCEIGNLPYIVLAYLSTFYMKWKNVKDFMFAPPHTKINEIPIHFKAFLKFSNYLASFTVTKNILTFAD